MKIQTEPRDDHQVKLTVEVEPELMEETKQRAARQLSRRVKMPGFRPGKAPYAVVVRQLGEAAIVEEALELLVKDIYPKAIDEAGIQPYGPGSLENVASMDPPTLEFVIPLEATVELGDYRELKKEYQPVEVSEDQVEAFLKDLQSRQAVLEPVERPVEEGDMAYVKLSAERVQPEEGQDPAIIRERSMPFLIHGEEEEGPTEWPFPGFSRMLIGMSAKEEKDFTYTFPEDTEFESLRGVEAHYHVLLEDVKARILPELNDEFATTVGDFETLEQLRQEIRKGLEQQARDQYNEGYDNELLQEAVDQATIKFPPQMLDREIDNVIHNLGHRLEEQNMDMDLYLKARNMTMDQMREEVRPTAESRLKNSLFLYELAEAEKIEVAQEDLQNETMRTLDDISRTMPEKEFKKLANRDVFSSVVNSVMADMISRRAVERLRSIASGIPEETPPAAEETSEVSAEVPEDGEEIEIASASGEPESGSPDQAPAQSQDDTGDDRDAVKTDDAGAAE